MAAAPIPSVTGGAATATAGTGAFTGGGFNVGARGITGTQILIGVGIVAVALLISKKK